MSADKIKKIFLISLIVVSFIGFIDATYLTIVHYQNDQLICNVFDKCEVVTTSPYSKVLGIPVALVGSIYYLVIFLAGILFTLTNKKIISDLMIYISPLGFIGSIWFVYVQLGILNAICKYCMVSAATSTLIFIICLFYFFKTRKNSTQINSSATPNL